MKPTKPPQNKLALYQSKDGALELKTDADNETIWANQKQIAQIFEVTPQNITIHLKNIFSSGELDEKSTCKESLQVQREGKREVKRKIKEYNLDVLIFIGYRIDSIKGTQFRIWATKTLKQHITQGFTINKARINTQKRSYRIVCTREEKRQFKRYCRKCFSVRFWAGRL